MSEFPESATSVSTDQFIDKKSETLPRRCILVLGMHRSGTSSLTRVLSMLGATLPKHVMGAAPSNATGHWEPERLVEYHDKLLLELGSAWDDWRALDMSRLTVKRRNEIKAEIGSILAADFADAPLFVLKDPRICRFAALFIEALQQEGIEAHVVLAYRNPLEVSESLRKRTGLWSPDHLPVYGILLWLRHVLDAEAATRDSRRAIVSYDGLLEHWLDTTLQLVRHLDITPLYAPHEIAGKVEHFLKLEQRHHYHTEEDLLLDPAMRYWCSETLGALDILQRNPESSSAMLNLDRVRMEFDRAAPLLDRLLREAVVAVASVRAQAEGLAAVAAETARAEAEARLRLDLNATTVKLADAVAAVEVSRARAVEIEAKLRRDLDAARARTAQRWAAHGAQTAAALEAATAKLQREIALRAKASAELEAATAKASRETALRAETLAELKAESAKLEESERARQGLTRTVESSAASLNAIEQSTMWRALYPARSIMKHFPCSYRQFGRRSLQMSWWVVTLQLLRRIRDET